MKNYRFVGLEKSDKASIITIDRGETNLLNIAIMGEINSVLQSLADDHSIKALVIRASGPVFSAGLDYTEAGPDSMELIIHPYHKMFRLLERIECPTISFVHGAAMGAGCELACFCDMVLAAEGARFGLPDIKLGLFSPVAAADFHRYGHLKHIYELLLLGDSVSAEEAKLMGLVNHVYPAGEFAAKCDEFLYRMSSNPNQIVRLAKKAARWGLEKKFSDALVDAEGVYLREMMMTQEARQGLETYKVRMRGEEKI
jgi:cyclohexa-1,5-dienecarbonyl-CoA hydratase